MSGKQGKNRFSKMNAIGIDHHIHLAGSLRVRRLKHLGKYRAEESIVLMIAGRPIQFAADPMDESCSIAFLIFARGLNFALMASSTLVLTQKTVEGKLEEWTIHRRGKGHAKDTANLYERI